MQDSVVIVTLRTEGFCRDFELPSNVALGELCPRLLAVLQKASGRIFGTWTGIILGTDQGLMLDKTATLLDYGICTGAYLSVRQEG